MTRQLSKTERPGDLLCDIVPVVNDDVPYTENFVRRVHLMLRVLTAIIFFFFK